jgi:hypothetical protein
MSNIDNRETKEYKIKRYHSNEIRLILFICATDLTNYDSEDLIIFTECIEGRIEVLLTPEYLKSLNEFIIFDDSALKKLQEIKDLLQRQYSSQWHQKMTDSNWIDLNKLSREILTLLKMEYQEPLPFMENNLEVDWT